MLQADQLKPLFDVFNLIQPLSFQVTEALKPLCQLRYFKKHEEIQAIGATCKTVYFVFSGAARIFYLKDGHEVTEYFAFENDLIIRAESLFTGNPSKKAIQALENSNVVAISSEALFRLFDQYPDLEKLFNKLVQRSYVETLKRLENLQFLTAEERYRKLLTDHPEIIQKIPLKYIASYLGITQVSLSRIRSSLR
ncbi:Crp/Fnr family transcriptional regulator [Algoriphagus mannitolivorans]|uniref:Crp/Fnr family transcriptional regulator n=1 Tax=Algoriphagus mannitolivorans TaxID=226504 RepID=UPI000425B8F5|nr:Crp/Fnr family transcriptional regulator [Algoriphagus mannitolivorans]